ncbi:MAG TPA: Bax inhibitor-1/YccA family protein [Rhizomicrobium sp.]|jgi:hypothetical protein
MADFNNSAWRGAVDTAGTYDAGLRAYMVRIYNYMLIGLLITATVALGTYSVTSTTDPALAATTLRNGVMLTRTGAMLYGSPLQWIIIFSPLVLALILQSAMPRISVSAARLGFLAFAAIMGVSLSSIFLIYTAASIAQVFFVTAAMFGGMSLYGYTTKADLSRFGSFLIMGVWGVVIASVVNVFLQSSMLSFVFSVIGVVVFTGITAYYTQTLKELYDVNDDGTVSGRKAIIGALALYITFINLFTSLLRLMGDRR